MAIVYRKIKLYLAARLAVDPPRSAHGPPTNATWRAWLTRQLAGFDARQNYRAPEGLDAFHEFYLSEVEAHLARLTAAAGELAREVDVGDVSVADETAPEPTLSDDAIALVVEGGVKPPPPPTPPAGGPGPPSGPWGNRPRPGPAERE